MANPFDVVIAGAGAAGIIAAWRAAQCGAKVALFEKTPRIGTKILISGGGKCNVAHDGPLEDLLKQFRPNERLFIRPACYRFDNRTIMSLISCRGLDLYTRPDGRVFPVNGDAKDVVAILQSYLEDEQVSVYTNTPTTGLEITEQGAIGIHVTRTEAKPKPAKPPLEGFGAGFLLSKTVSSSDGDGIVWDGPSLIQAKAIVIATGGSSYPKSGTTGDGWAWMRKAGHQIVKPAAALAPIYLHEADPTLAGVSARDVLLKARGERGVFASARGDVLFTHLGVSGPAVLQISREVAEHLPEPVSLELDLYPDTKLDELRPHIANIPVTDRLPKSLWMRFLSDLGPNQKVKNKLADQAKAWKIGQVRTVPLERGEVVAGGVSLDEVDPKTMASRIVPNLFLCGEILDVAGPVGGYNLQAAFATGYIAGESAAKLAAQALS